MSFLSENERFISEGLSTKDVFNCLKKEPATFKKKKGLLPTKICASCGRPFEWRKRWERNWDEVRYCSERCRRNHEHTA